MAGCGGAVGSAGEGRKGDSVELERGEPAFFFMASISLFTALELLPELCNLLESSRRTRRGQRRDVNIEQRKKEK